MKVRHKTRKSPSKRNSKRLTCPFTHFRKIRLQNVDLLKRIKSERELTICWVQMNKDRQCKHCSKWHFTNFREKTLLWYSNWSMGLPRLQIRRELNHVFLGFFIAYKQLEVDTALSKTNTVAHLVNFNDKSFLNNDTWWQYHSIIMSDLKKVPITDGDQTRSFNWKSILSLNLTSECNKCTVYKKSSASSITLKNNCANLS